jgi:hypothetical protein
MDITPPIQLGILTHKGDTIGQLECLLALHDRVAKRTKDEIDEYRKVIMDPELFHEDIIFLTSGITEFKTSKNKLKPCLFKWMVRFTDHAPSALYTATLAKTTWSHIQTGLASFVSLYKQHYKNKSSPVASDKHLLLKKVLSGTRYECLFAMIDGIYQVTYTDSVPGKKVDQRGKIFHPNLPVYKTTDHGLMSIFKINKDFWLRLHSHSDLLAHQTNLIAKQAKTTASGKIIEKKDSDKVASGEKIFARILAKSKLKNNNMEEEDDKKDHADVVSSEKRIADEPRAKSQSDSQSNDRKKGRQFRKRRTKLVRFFQLRASRNRLIKR